MASSQELSSLNDAPSVEHLFWFETGRKIKKTPKIFKKTIYKIKPMFFQALDAKVSTEVWLKHKQIPE